MDDQLTLDNYMFETVMEFITTGVGKFISGVFAPVLDFCSTNWVALAFLSVTFAGLGVRLVRKTITAFGRGR